MLSIQTNISSMSAQENLRVNNSFQSRTIARVTSGFRINDSADDAAGLAVANRFRSDVSELMQGVRNANDGISTLQIIDGGLNNISKMLDRLKTLATQSASQTFKGNRATLNNEYSDLMNEINRQAGMVGLSTGAKGGRYNRDINVFVGGTKQGTSKVSIALSGAANRVDADALGLTATNINNGKVSSVTGINSMVLTGKTDILTGGQSQSFTFNFEGGVSKTFTITGDADGYSSVEALAKINDQISSYGVTAVTDKNGKLGFSGSTAFTMSTTAASANAFTQNAQAITGSNLSMYSIAGGQAYDAGTAETITATAGGVSIDVALGTTETAATAAQKLNDGLKSLGIKVTLDSAGTGISFQSAGDFTVTSTHGGAATEGVFADQGVTKTTTAPTADGTETSSAEAAITAITNAVTALGNVQGKVGTAQNKLQYSMQLAQSQIVSFSAAESRIRDADVATEAANLTKAQVLQQASIAALAQANAVPQAVLSLLRG